MQFAREHEDKTPDDWCEYLQGVGDLKEFTFYPKKLMSRFKRYRCKWTYMKPHEKYLPAFVRPKRWYPKKVT